MRRLALTSLLLVLAAATSPACGGDDDPAGAGGTGGTAGVGGTGGTGGQIDPDAPALLGQDCDPISTHCGFPFPSDVYLVDDAGTPSGKRVRFGRTTLPRFAFGPSMDPALWAELDGFSPGQAPMAYFPRVSPDGFPTPESIPESLADEARTILIEADTGRRIPHWVDVDHSTRFNGLNDLDDERAFMIRPAVHLKHGTRYVVAVRGLRDYDGALIEPSPVFQALRDGTESSEPSVGLRRDHYARLFGELEAAGIAKDDLQLAWDYTTASRENTTGKLIRMRDLALEAVGADGPEFVVKSVEDDPNPHIKHRVTLTMQTPLFLNHARNYDVDDPEQAAFHLDAEGRVAPNGMMEFDVLVHIPHAVDDGQPLGLLQNGHGLFGRKTEGQNGYLAATANGYGWLAFATDLFGFSEHDVPLAINALGGDPHLLSSFVARQHQGHVNQLTAMRMMMGRVARDGIQDGGRTLLPPGAVDPSLRAYRGDSQGGIMGAVYMTISTDVTRGLLGETGFPYNLLLNRSVDWPGYGLVLGAATETGLDVQLVLGLIQMLWDQTEPSGYVNYLASDTLPGTPAHRVLIHSAIGDHQVSTYAAQLMARSIGAKNLLSSDGKLPRATWGIDSASGPITEGSVLVEFDFNLAPEPLTNVPATDGCDPHDRVRVLTPAYEMQDRFFRTGAIDATCDGVCNCDGPGAEDGCAATCN
ncbi:MAG: hypothetical protein KIT72_08440 [Polyangiaceae bacterium]|nr:hypothetical protein [Polyangiaceae bacterium]MCW5790435.1 hypothetical protein [Polyangiaceae bacterium]